MECMILLIKHLAGDNLSFDAAFAWRAFFFDEVSDVMLNALIAPTPVMPSAASNQKGDFFLDETLCEWTIEYQYPNIVKVKV